MRVGDRHLAYCTNVHPAEDVDGILDQFDRFALPIRDELGVDRLGLGLWLAAPVAAELAGDPDRCRKLRHELNVRGLETVTFNGFPYEAFQAPVVKHAVYHPDWTDPRRLRYTLDLAAVLCALLPDDVERGSISTLPLAWRDPWSPPQADAAYAQLRELANGLSVLPRSIRVALEPEPGCVIESSSDAVTHLASFVDTEHIGVCVDLAHLACGWEDPHQAVGRLTAAGLPIVKAQISAALEVGQIADAGQFVEPRFLHQTRSSGGEAFDDLPEALASGVAGACRVHFHVPLHTGSDTLDAGIAALQEAGVDHLEVETYTWTVLPEAQRPVTDADLVRGIAAELRYARERLS